MSAWSERMIGRAICHQLLQRKCVVLVPNCNWTGNECDVLAVTTDLRIIDVEVKISRADLKADAHKDKWWRHLSAAQARERGIDVRTWNPWDHREACEHPKKVWKHYYALPAEIWTPELVERLPSKASGILLLSRGKTAAEPLAVRVERRATPARDAYRLTPGEAVDIARLANLRMWDAYRAHAASENEIQRLRAQREAA